MRRLAMVGIGLALMGVATGCPGDVSSPPPVVTSITASPSPAVAGGPFTIEVQASHPQGIFEAHVMLLARSTGFLPAHHACATASAQPPSGPGPEAVVTITCTLPPAMQNGTDWSARVNVTSNAGTTTFADAPFTVTGGSDDVTGPVVTPAATVPTSAALGSTFAVDLHLADDHPPFHSLVAVATRDGGELGEPAIDCVTGTAVPIDATSAHMTVTCHVGPTVVAGAHQVHVFAADDLGSLGSFSFPVTVA